MTRASPIDADWVAKRDARIVRLWNDGMTRAALASRFSLTPDGVASILRREKAAGVQVRSGQWA